MSDEGDPPPDGGQSGQGRLARPLHVARRARVVLRDGRFRRDRIPPRDASTKEALRQGLIDDQGRLDLGRLFGNVRPGGWAGDSRESSLMFRYDIGSTSSAPPLGRGVGRYPGTRVD